MVSHLPQHLLLGIASVPLVTSQPLYQQYNLRPRDNLPRNQPPSIHHRLLQVNDFELTFDVTSTSCHSPLIDWSMSHVKEMGYSIYKELFDSRILDMPYIYKHYIDKNEDEESFGYDGSQTKELVKRHADTMAFWTEADVDDSITTDGILLLSMHGSDLLDNEKLVPTIIHMYDFDNENDVLEFANKVKEYVQDLPGGHNNPLLTMNAVATRGGKGGRSGKTIASLIIGDGVLQFVEDSNLSSSGPDFIHSHEFGHHLQYEMDMVHNVPPGYENDIRRKELMADAISAYFLAHDRGGNMEAHEISEFSMVAFATGDCNTGQEDHHGTPKQRYCASVWGASRAALSPDNFSLIDPETFVELFNADYGKMLELDEATCTLIIEEPDDDTDYSDAYEPGSAETDYFETNSPSNVEAAFSTNEEDYETTDGSSAYEEALYSKPGGYDTIIEPPHETTYKHGLPGSDISLGEVLSESETHDTTIEPPHETSYKQGLPGAQNHGRNPQGYGKGHESATSVQEALDSEDNEALVLVAGHPSQSHLHDLKGEDKMYACNLPWVYCDDAMNLSNRRVASTAVSALIALSLFVLL